MSDKKKEKNKMTWREAFRLNTRAMKLWWKKYPQMFAANILNRIVYTIVPYINIWFSARMIGELAGERNRERLFSLILALLLLDVCFGVARAALAHWNTALFWTAYEGVNCMYNEKLLSMDFASLDSSHTRDLFAKIQQNDNWANWGLRRTLNQLGYGYLIDGTVGIAGAAVLSLPLFTRSAARTAGGLAIINSPLVNVLLLGLLLGAVLLSPALVRRADNYWAGYSEEARFGNRAFGFFGHAGYARHRALDVRIYRQDVLFHKKLDIADSKSFGIKSPIAKSARGASGLLHASSDLVGRVFTGAVYLFVCIKAWAGACDVGEVTQYIGAITLLYETMANLLRQLGEMRTNASFLQDTFEFLDIPDDMYKGSLTTEKRRDCNYEIEFCNVSFRYPGTETDVLKNVSLKFRVGEKLAVVGENGSGKTTFIKLLCRLYDPTEGEIKLNGIDIRKYSYREYMAIFSVVFQDYKLLAFSLGQNVAAGMDYDADKVNACLKEAGVEERVSRMKDGLETFLYKDFDDEGVEISGGEAQKIAIARALYKDAAFLILDEPTAALDPVAEYEVYTKFNEIVGERTAIYISHRLASCRFCDEIAVFDKGRVCQRGSHEKLLADTGGKYYALWHAQAQYYEKENVGCLCCKREAGGL